MPHSRHFASVIILLVINLIKQFQAYQPFNEQESVDRELFLQLLKMPNYLTRNNHFGHLTASAFIVNQAHTKMLVVHHNIFDGLIYPGGHADGDSNLLHVALKETKEETNLTPRVLESNFFGIQALPIAGHQKHGHYVSSHIHFDVIYLFETDEKEILKFRPEESKAIRWIPFAYADSSKVCDFIRPIHRKLIAKLKEQDTKK